MKHYICGDSFSSNNIDTEVYNSNKRKFSNLKRHQQKHVSCYSFHVIITKNNFNNIFLSSWYQWMKHLKFSTKFKTTYTKSALME